MLFLCSRMKDQWYHARAAAVIHNRSGGREYLEKTNGAILSHVVDNELSFRALDGFDSMRHNAPCGFDLKSLEMLFPEEMGAYKRWKKVSVSLISCLLFVGINTRSILVCVLF